MLQILPTTMAEYGPDESSTDSACRPSPPIYDAHTALELRSQYTEHVRDWATSEKILSERPSELSVIAVMGATRSGKLAFGTVKMGHNLSSCKCSQQFRHPGL